MIGVSTLKSTGLLVQALIKQMPDGSHPFVRTDRLTLGQLLFAGPAGTSAGR